MTSMNNRHSSERGQGMVEYGLILSMVSLFAVVLLAFLGSGIADMFTNILGSL